MSRYHAARPTAGQPVLAGVALPSRHLGGAPVGARPTSASITTLTRTLSAGQR